MPLKQSSFITGLVSGISKLMNNHCRDLRCCSRFGWCVLTRHQAFKKDRKTSLMPFLPRVQKRARYECCGSQRTTGNELEERRARLALARVWVEMKPCALHPTTTEALRANSRTASGRRKPLLPPANYLILHYSRKSRIFTLNGLLYARDRAWEIPWVHQWNAAGVNWKVWGSKFSYFKNLHRQMLSQMSLDIRFWGYDNLRSKYHGFTVLCSLF